MMDDSISGSETTASPKRDNLSGRADDGRLVQVFTNGEICEPTPRQLKDDLTVVGRTAFDGIRLADPAVSRVHGRIVRDVRTGCYRLGDADSRYGTYVNGARISSFLLADNDVVRFGDTLFVFQLRDSTEEIRRSAETAALDDAPVLITGETGAGKEVLARQIHEKSARQGKFVAVNCAALPEQLAVAELFGYRRGAFSGASENRPGLIMAADHGTLFLDEVGDLPPKLQPTLLRVLQDNRVRPLGGEREEVVDLRFVAATNRPLDADVAAGSFRADLYARLAHIVIELPPLRSRRVEILTLANQIIAKHSFAISPDAAEALLISSWPFNVRDLQALGARLHPPSTSLDYVDLPRLQQVAPDIVAGLIKARQQYAPELESRLASPVPPPFGVQQLREALAQHRGNVVAVSTALGMHRTQVYRLMRQWGLAAEEFRDR
jgi:transcriptional regulator with PAS, ATPase and Fis domain